MLIEKWLFLQNVMIIIVLILKDFSARSEFKWGSLNVPVPNISAFYERYEYVHVQHKD